MKQIFLFAIAALFFSNHANCQLGGLMKKIKNKVDQRVDNKVDQGIDKTLDKAEGKSAASAPPPATTGGQTPAKNEEPALNAFSRYDFVPGEKILYTEDFAQDALGELPTGWNSSGTGEVIKLDKFPGQWMRLHKSVSYLTANQKTFGENYTLEFDMILQFKNNGWMYPEIKFGLLSSKDELPDANAFLEDYTKYAAVTTSLFPGEFNSSKARLVSFANKESYFKGDPKSIEPLQNWWGQPVHVALQVQKERFRLWINDLKVFDIPKAVPVTDTMNQLRIEIAHTNYSERDYGIYISNIKIATGLPDSRHKLIEEGKFSTNGILFDWQSAVVKPPSYGVIKEIAAVLKDNGSVKVRIIGHTSSDGDDKANMELSQQRAGAVKELLVKEFGIDGDRITTDGKGETEPVADNKTKEGRAQNRRVEFIKI